MTESERLFFIKEIAPYVQKYAARYGVLCPSAVIGQACLESAYGSSGKAKHNNFFGLKYRKGRLTCHSGFFKDGSKEEYKPGQLVDISDYWYAFTDMEHGVEGYFQFTNIPAYAGGKGTKDPETYLARIKAAGYATSKTYVRDVMRIVQQYDLQQYDEVPQQEGEKEMAKKFNVHGGHNRHCPGAHGVFDEVTEDRKVKDRVIKLLREQGHTVYDCTDDDGPTANANLYNIVKKCNQHTVDLDISIHFNAFNRQAHGVEVCVYSGSVTAAPAARICREISKLGFTNRGVKQRPGLYVLRNTTSPALLVECCFCDSAEDARIYNADKMAEAIVKGILNISELQKKEEKTEEKKEEPGEHLYKVIKACPIREGAGRKYPITGRCLVGIYTIVEKTENWGKLKSGAGWIALKNTVEV